MNRGDKNTVRVVAFGCALLMTLGMVSTIGVAAPIHTDTRATSGVSAETTADSVTGTGVQPTDRRTLAADSHSDEGCVVDSFGSVYPELVEVRCTESESGDTSLAIGGTGGWAYALYLEIPPGTNKTGILGRGGEVIPRIGDTRAERAWANEIPKFGDEVVIVSQSSFDVEQGRSDAFLFAHEPGSIFQSVPPGVYNMRVVVYQKLSVTEIQSSRSGPEYYRQVIDKAPRKESELTVELGPCRADYNAEQRLENVDQNMLETYEKLGEAKAEYSKARRSFSDNVESLTVSVLAGAVSKTAEWMITLTNLMKGSPDPKNIRTLANMQMDLEKGAQAQKAFEKRVAEIKELQSKKSSIFEGVERCNGEPYSLEKYQAPSPSEIQDAIDSGGDEQ
ncbi:hypothetical protein [Halovenus halobia]|uniref:hypothetical protein n=1 Tax=Halovenus halobia TaxID=3396622 RepID=UPI003F573E98